jgi:Fur family zinc uptake transcriptional regulator
MPNVFPAPDHNHERCAADVIAHAVEQCTARGQRLTPMRRKVLEILAGSHKPLGAYEVMDAVAAGGPRPAPITVYRALDFLKENGLVHRIESRNAFLACGLKHDSGAVVAFLICERCGEAGEAPGPEIAGAVAAAAGSAGFAPHMSVVEITGICANCGARRSVQT